MEATAGPLPRLKMDGPENADDVGSDLCADSADSQQCRSRQTVSMLGVQSDSNVMMKNANLEARIRLALFKVQVGLQQNNLHYDRFKIRTTNNIDQF